MRLRRACRGGSRAAGGSCGMWRWTRMVRALDFAVCVRAGRWADLGWFRFVLSQCDVRNLHATGSLTFSLSRPWTRFGAGRVTSIPATPLCDTPSLPSSAASSSTHPSVLSPRASEPHWPLPSNPLAGDTVLTTYAVCAAIDYMLLGNVVLRRCC